MDKQDNASESLDLKPTPGTVGSRTVVYGEFIAGGTVCKESAINNVVARVHLDPLNCDEFIVNKTKSVQSTESTSKGIKRKLQESPSQEADDAAHAENQIKKRGRGRPKKIQEGITSPKVNATSENDTPSVRKRGRPRKLPDGVEDASQDIVKSKLKSNLDAIRFKQNLFKVKRIKRFNGDKSAAIITTARIRKPNSRFQDFVVSPNVRYYAPSRAESPPEEKALPIKVKPKPKLPKPTNKSNVNEDDPLDIPDGGGDGGDDEVRSFLPIFDEPPRFDNVLILKNNNDATDVTDQLSISNKRFKEKENQANNLQPKLRKSISSPDSQKTDDGDYSPPKLRNSNSKLPTSTVKSPKIRVYSSANKAHEQVTQSTAVNNNGGVSQKKPKLKDTESDVQKRVTVKQNSITTVTPATPKGKTKVNGSNNALRQKKNASYILVESDSSPNRTKVAKPSDVDFNKLVRSLKSVKLPAVNWKIRIVVSRQQTITEVTFTNKEVNERCVKFSRIFTGYVITFGKSVVKLLGAPLKISSFNDVTILLDIIHNVSSNDPVLEYSTDKDV